MSLSSRGLSPGVIRRASFIDAVEIPLQQGHSEAMPEIFIILSLHEGIRRLVALNLGGRTPLKTREYIEKFDKGFAVLLNNQSSAAVLSFRRYVLEPG